MEEALSRGWSRGQGISAINMPSINYTLEKLIPTGIVQVLAEASLIWHHIHYSSRDCKGGRARREGVGRGKAELELWRSAKLSGGIKLIYKFARQTSLKFQRDFSVCVC